MQPVSGLILLDKPPGPTCARALNQIKRTLPPATRLGHAGTLDSFATGLVILLAGQATRLCEQLMSLPKRYRATIQLGSTTPTDDPEFAPTPYRPPPETPARLANDIPTESEIARIFAKMIGTVMQRPPIYSALKMRGKRSSDRARAGQLIAPAARPVRIDTIQLIHYAWPTVDIIIDCGRGAYIRSIARDLGEALNVGGHLTQLRRMRIGPFSVNDGQSLDALAGKIESPRLIEVTTAFDLIRNPLPWPALTGNV
jgi:tRNA pseudouridine55 synthase